jgi:tetratricopeptide (TPR) repeat protein
MCGLLALGSKENAAVLPVIILLYEWYFFRDLSFAWLKRRLILILVVLCAMSVFALVYTDGQLIERSIGGYGGRDFTLLERMLTQPRVVFHYLSLLFYPDPNRLVLDYDFPVSTSFFSPVSTLISIAGIVVLAFLAVVVAQRERLLSFCILWFFLNLLVESSIIPLEMVYEHRTYLPSMMLLLLMVVFVYRIFRRLWIIYPLICVMTVVCLLWTVERNEVWRNPIKFWESSLRHFPNDSRIQVNLGKAYYEVGKRDLAGMHFKKAVDLGLKKPDALNNWGVIELQTGNIQHAEELFKIARDRDPRHSPTLLNLGKLYLKLKRFDEAEVLFTALLKNTLSDDMRTEIHSLLIFSYVKEKKFAQAVRLLEAGEIEKSDNQDDLAMYAESLQGVGAVGKARAILEKIIAINFSRADAHYNLAKIFVNTDNLQRAVQHYHVASINNQVILPVDYDFANTLLRLNQYDEAREKYEKYIASIPKLADAFNNLGLAYIQTGNRGEAIRNFRIAVEIDSHHAMARQNLEIAIESGSP